MRSQNWFQKHPNGTAVIAILLGFVVVRFGSLEAAQNTSNGLAALIYYFVQSRYLQAKELVFVLLGLGICLPVLGWACYQKRGAIWWPGWVLLPFIPFGWIIVIFTGRPRLTVLNFGRPMSVHTYEEEIYGFEYWRGLRQTICWATIIALIRDFPYQL